MEPKLEEYAIMGLKKCVKGFNSKEIKATYDIDGNGGKYLKNEVITTKQIAPEFNAIVFTLTNLNPSKWRSKPDGTLSATNCDEPIDLSTLSDEAMLELSKYLDN